MLRCPSFGVGKMKNKKMALVGWRRRFISGIYATHNRAFRIKKALARCMERLKDGELGLNVGSGTTRLHPAIVNLDLIKNPTVDICAQAEFLPFGNSVFQVVCSQETLEHVQNPPLAIREMYRVLQEGGTLYCQLPFIIGYHPGPTDYWRFTKEGIRELVEHAGFVCEEVEIAVGPATGFYRIAVEFFAIVMSSVSKKFYFLTKAVMAILFFPLKWLDVPLSRSENADRIAGGYYVIAKKG